MCSYSQEGEESAATAEGAATTTTAATTLQSPAAAALKASSTASSSSATTAAGASSEVKPFQRLQFLVRDWQNFDHEYEEGQDNDAAAFAALQQEMQTYLAEVIKTRGLNDLQSTREQIVRCFEKLDCFMLPHPGFSVVKKNYDGAISKIDPFFRALVNKYVRILFDQELDAKVINGRKLSGKELQTYFEVYVKMFQAGQKSFPKAMTMLDATAGTFRLNNLFLCLVLQVSFFSGPVYGLQCII